VRGGAGAAGDGGDCRGCGEGGRPAGGEGCGEDDLG